MTAAGALLGEAGDFLSASRYKESGLGGGVGGVAAAGPAGRPAGRTKKMNETKRYVTSPAVICVWAVLMSRGGAGQAGCCVGGRRGRGTRRKLHVTTRPTRPAHSPPAPIASF